MASCVVLLVLMFVVGVSAVDDCYDVTQPSLTKRFGNSSLLVRVCRASGDIGASTCHDTCLAALTRERASDCFAHLQHMGHTCEDLLGLILSVLSLGKTGIPGCRSHINDICQQENPSLLTALPWHTILAVAAGSLVCCAMAMYGAWYFVDKMGLPHYEGSDDMDWRNTRSPISPAGSSSPDEFHKGL